jgi:hypothetical protein
MPQSDETLITRRSLLAVLALMLLFGVALHLEGRPAWCQSGLGLWSNALSQCTSQSFLDPYSLSHVLHGIIFFWLLWPLTSKSSLPWRLVMALMLEVGWEVFENSTWVIERYRQDTAALDYTGDSILNALGDAASAIVGFIFASRFSWKASISLFVVFELWMLYLARDNLTLNVLMLLHPIESIRHWQLGG